MNHPRIRQWGTTGTGRPGFVVALATTLLALDVPCYRVNELLERRLAAAEHRERAPGSAVRPR